MDADLRAAIEADDRLYLAYFLGHCHADSGYDPTPRTDLPEELNAAIQEWRAGRV